MTKEDAADQYDSRVASLLAVHLVSQVLDEAYIIANAAKESGEPWLYISMLKTLRNGGPYEIEAEDTTFASSKCDNDANENKMDPGANIIATSTPQKIAGERNYTGESSFIGQGDEEMELEQGHLTKSTSVFINNLFDMSEVEHVIFSDDNIVKPSCSESNEILTRAMTKIMESYINTALGIAFEEHPVSYGISERPSCSTEYTDYSFLTDVHPSDITKEIGFCVEDAVSVNENYGNVVDNIALDVTPHVKEYFPDPLKQDEVALYETTYLTLNRDYEQYSDDGDPILQDPKELALQEIELMTANTSDINLTHNLEEEELEHKIEVPTVVPAISVAEGVSRKSSLVRRCRNQGARLWARLRGWWRRKPPSKHRGPSIFSRACGMCPLSPDARRRAASLLDQRLLRSPLPSHPTLWKFNTVNEALVNSSRWKEYTFDKKTDDCSEY